MRLHASSAALRDRIARRAEGEGPLLAGDTLVDAPPARQDEIHGRAVAESEALEPGQLASWHVVDTTSLDGAAAARAVMDLWVPDQRAGPCC